MCIRIESVGKNKEVTEDCFRRKTKTPSTDTRHRFDCGFLLTFFLRRRGGEEEDGVRVQVEDKKRRGGWERKGVTCVTGVVVPD
jgi:hypothetical protein